MPRVSYQYGNGLLAGFPRRKARPPAMPAWGCKRAAQSENALVCGAYPGLQVAA